ncbi:MAG: IS4 family transposase [Bacteroidales bacterium]|nr:IS4 family transposase [Bacteroidales bacterium]
MKTNSSIGKISQCKVTLILAQLETKTINKIARLSGYIQRKTCKIAPKSLIIGFMIMVSKQRNTYTDWATEVGFLEGKVFSKQALNERMRPQTEIFVKRVVEGIVSKHTPELSSRKVMGVLRHFNNVKIDDSTTISLPDAMAKEFPGSVTRGVQKAQAKIHAMYNLTDNNFSFLDVHSFANNDQSLSANVLPYLEKGDLCIRDLGFTILDVVSKFIEKGIYFVARKSYSTNVYDVETKVKINLLKELRKKKFIDKEVFIGSEKQIRLRLIAHPVSAEQAAVRRRKAKADRDKRLNHSLNYYELLGYSIYITNISPLQCNANEVFLLYKLRWRIEIIFKSWKSCFSLEKIIHRQCKNPIRVKCMIYLMLLYIYLFHVVWWRYCEGKVPKGLEQVELSILKLANFFKNNFSNIISGKSNRQLISQMLAHCRYDKRNDRENAKQLHSKLAA